MPYRGHLYQLLRPLACCQCHAHRAQACWVCSPHRELYPGWQLMRALSPGSSARAHRCVGRHTLWQDRAACQSGVTLRLMLWSSRSAYLSLQHATRMRMGDEGFAFVCQHPTSTVNSGSVQCKFDDAVCFVLLVFAKHCRRSNSAYTSLNDACVNVPLTPPCPAPTGVMAHSAAAML